MLKKSIFALALLITAASVNADAPRKSPWNYTTATNYAIQWAKSRNPSYINFPKDCTNFASQALRTGGWKDTTTLNSTQASSWFYKSGTNYAQTWSTAHGLKNRLTNGYELGAEKLGKSFLGTGPEYLNNKIRVGDVILADWYSDGQYDHSMIVTDVSFSSTLVSYHSADELNKSMSDISDKYPNATFLVYHIS